MKRSALQETVVRSGQIQTLLTKKEMLRYCKRVVKGLLDHLSGNRHVDRRK